MADTQSNFETLTFAAQSTPGSLERLARGEMEEGSYIALCRVLSVRTLKVNGDVSDADLIYASENGYDTVHSEAL